MALITCPECGREVSDQAASCPQCGYPISSINTKPQTYDVFVVQKLSDDKISAFAQALHEENIVFRNVAASVLSRAPTPIKKEVSKETAERIKSIADGLDIHVTITESPPSAPISHTPNVPRCPKCGSTSIQMVRKSFSFGKATVGAILLGPIGGAAGFVNNKFQRVCVACGHKF